MTGALTAPFGQDIRRFELSKAMKSHLVTNECRHRPNHRIQILQKEVEGWRLRRYDALADNPCANVGMNFFNISGTLLSRRTILCKTTMKWVLMVLRDGIPTYAYRREIEEMAAIMQNLKLERRD